MIMDIKTMRDYFNINQHKFGQLFDVSTASISRWENDLSKGLVPKIPEHVIKLMEALQDIIDFMMTKSDYDEQYIKNILPVLGIKSMIFILTQNGMKGSSMLTAAIYGVIHLNSSNIKMKIS